MSTETGGWSTPPDRFLVLDANIIVRAVLGRRVLSLLQRYASQVTFLTAVDAVADARAHLPAILARRGMQPSGAARLVAEVLDRLPLLVTVVPEAVYVKHEREARSRLAGRDEADWPYVALAMQFECPVWTEDQDFFGTGVATWTTDRIELYLWAGR